MRPEIDTATLDRELSHMDGTVSEDPHTVIWLFGIVVSAFGLVSVMALMGWLPQA